MRFTVVVNRLTFVKAAEIGEPTTRVFLERS